MKRLPRLASAALIVVTVLAGAPARPQAASGGLYGMVADDRGHRLAGATVTVSAAHGPPRVQATNDRGEFRFVGLEPALYHTQVELDGYTSAEYPDIPVRLGRSTTIEATLVPTDSGAVILTAECPLLDERRISSGVDVTREELDTLPTARTPWALLEQAPGVLRDVVDVGGVGAIQPSTARAAGAGIGQNAYFVDGVPLADPADLDRTPPLHDFGSFEEAEVTTGGTHAAIATAGVTLNLVTRRGTDRWRAGARFLYADGDWQPRPDDLELGPGQPAFTPPERLETTREGGVDAGGALVRDRLWAWGGLDRVRLDLALEPLAVGSPRGPGDREAETATLKLDLAPGAATRLQLFLFDHDVETAALDGGPERAPESTLLLHAPTTLWKVEDSQQLGSRVHIAGRVSEVDGDFDLAPRAGRDALPVIDAAGVLGGGYVASDSRRLRRQAEITASAFLDARGHSHELELGVGYQQVEVDTSSRWGSAGVLAIDPASPDLPSTNVLYRPASSEVDLDVSSAYLQDTIAGARLVADLGLRFERQRAARGPGALAPHPVRPDLLPAASLQGSPEVSWRNVAPRLGLTYGIGETHATLVRASWSRFIQPLGTSPLESAISDPTTPPFSFAALRFFDRDGDRRAGAGETQVALAGDLGGVVPAPDLEAPLTDELLLGAEHAGVGCISLGGRITWRRQSDLLERRPFLLDTGGTVRVAIAGDYLLDSVAAGTLPDGEAYTAPVYSLRPELSLLGSDLLVNGARRSEYWGGTVWLERRLRNRWQFRAYANVREETTEAPAEHLGTLDPTNLVGFDDDDGAPFGPRSVLDRRDLYLHSRWDYSLSGLYRARWGLALSLLAHGREGFPLLYWDEVTPADGRPRRVAVTDERSPFRLENVHLLDLRVEKGVRMRTAALTISLEAFNLLNGGAALERDSRLDGPTADFVREIVSPRVVRVGARLELGRRR